MATPARSICIVGAGPAGLTLASKLAARGWRVTIVEGGAMTPSPTLEDTFRVAMTGTPHRGVHEGRFRAWGGSTTRWGGQLWAWEPYEFEARPALGIDGWPIPAAEIIAHYPAAFATFGVPGIALDADRAVRSGMRALPLDRARFGLKFSITLPWRLRNVGRTIGRALRGDARVTVIDGATATRILTSGGGARAEAVELHLPSGAKTTVAADVVVIAGGAVETTRLMFASDDASLPDGSRAWLGGGFMDHLSVRVARFHPRDERVFAETFAPLLQQGVQFNPRIVVEPPLRRQDSLLLSYAHWDVAPSPDSPVFALRALLRSMQAGRVPRPSAREMWALFGGAGEVARFADTVIRRRRRPFPDHAAIHLRVDSEQRPLRESRLAPTGERDRHGLPRLELDWRVSPLERHTVRRTAELVLAELERVAAGTADPLVDPFAREDGWGELKGDSFHMMGGTRMANAPGDGVVDRDLRVFGMENLYLASTSVFPTGGMANPTLTLIALTHRLAEHIDETT